MMHCKRSSHFLPQNASIKTSKSAVTSPPISVQLLVLPLIVDSPTSSTAGQRLVTILPKTSDCETQTTGKQRCDNCKTHSKVNDSKALKKVNSISIQTDCVSQKRNRSSEQRSAECQTNRKRNRNPKSNSYESIETQTLESAFQSNQLSSQKCCVKISASTSTSPPKKTRKKCFASFDVNNGVDVEKLCAFTQTSDQMVDTKFTTGGPDLLVNCLNPLLSQTNSNLILEQSVQTEANDVLLDNEFINIETQTVNLDIDAKDLLEFDGQQELLFSDLEFTDIETQTIWNNDRTTQTDEHLDQINDAFLKYLDDDSECDIKSINDRIVFTDTQTQTHID